MNIKFIIMKDIYLPHYSKQKGSTIGESYFLQLSHWKLAVMLGYSWRDDVLIKSGFSFFNRKLFNGKYVDRIINFLDENNIKYSTEYSNGGWQYIIKISKAKKYLDIIDNLYKQYYKKTLKDCKGLYIYDNWFITEETFLKYKSYHKNNPDWTLNIL